MSTTVLPQVSAWSIDPAHSAAEFKIKHMMISNVKGQFSGVRGTLLLDDGDITRSRVEASIDAASIDTRETQRDAHLRSADFLDVEKFPTLSFRSSRVERADDGGLKVTGDLTIHGVTRSVVFAAEEPSAPVQDPWGGTRFGFTATARINRRDFGLTWNKALETGGILVGDEVTIGLDVEFVKS